MATIQIREVPTGAYEVIRQRARAEGKSIQAYMRDLVIEVTGRPTKAEAVAEVRRLHARYGGARLTPEQIVAHIEADRR